ncbi:MAG: hypothetical protein ABI454_02910 [Sphingomicrobium sp.]
MKYRPEREGDQLRARSNNPRRNDRAGCPLLMPGQWSETGMNFGDEHSRSYWMEETPVIEAPSLTSDESCVSVIVGAGIVGLSTAYELSRAGPVRLGH